MKNPIVISVVVITLAVIGFGAYSLFQSANRPESMMKNEDAMMGKDDNTMQSSDTMKGEYDASMIADEDANAMMDKDEGIPQEDKMMENKMENSRYVPYSKTVLDNSSNSRRVLFFYASWCPTCVPADANFKQNASKIPEDVTLIRVNYNDPDTDQEENNLAKKYGITYQHTFVQIDGSGKVVTKWNGGQIDQLLASIK